MNQAISYKLKYFQTLMHPDGKEPEYIELNTTKTNSWIEMEKRVQNGFIRKESVGEVGENLGDLGLKMGNSLRASQIADEDKHSKLENISSQITQEPISNTGAFQRVTVLEAVRPQLQRSKSQDEYSARADSEDSSSGAEKKVKRFGEDGVPIPLTDYESLLALPYSVLKQRNAEMSSMHSLVLMKAAVTIFEGKEVTGQDLSFLTEKDLLILSAFFGKKCKLSFETNQSRDKIAAFINEHRTYYKHKRNEENYKLVFKKAIKSLSKKLKQTLNPPPKDKFEMAQQFYDKYFREPFHQKGLHKEYNLLDEGNMSKRCPSVFIQPQLVRQSMTIDPEVSQDVHVVDLQSQNCQSEVHFDGSDQPSIH